MKYNYFILFFLITCFIKGQEQASIPDLTPLVGELKLTNGYLSQIKTDLNNIESHSKGTSKGISLLTQKTDVELTNMNLKLTDIKTELSDIKKEIKEYLKKKEMERKQ